MIYLMIDTCIWLDLAKDPHQQKLLGILDDLIEQQEVELVIPQITIDEFARNKDRIIDETKKSILGNIKRVKEVVAKFGEMDHKENILTQLSDLNHKAPLMGEYAATGSVNWAEAYFRASTPIPTSETHLLKAAQRAVQKKAPFHRNKNSMADAILIEIYTE